jgi:glucose-6-phosphate 1-dehydrogenase
MAGEGGSCTLIIFGASGDLSQRKLIPALFRLSQKGLVGAHLRILGVGRTDFSDESFRDHVAVQDDNGAWTDFAQRLSYLTGSYENPAAYEELKSRLEAWCAQEDGPHNRLFYLAVPPKVYPEIIRQLAKSGLNHSDHGWTHVIVEKPFGHDLESARHLNQMVHTCFEENQVYRIDHYLGKETVQNILAFRFANYVFDELWRHHDIDHVQITAAETSRVDQRAGYYDENGVVRDMVQSHLLQLLTLIAMEAPAAMNAQDLRDEKMKLLRAVREPDPTDLILGQYEGYRQEEGVDPQSLTPTYAALKLFIDNRRWHGIPFYLRTGKALPKKATEISVQFKQVVNPIFEKRHGPLSNVISFCIQPDEGIHLSFQLKDPGGEMTTSPVIMNFRYRDLIGDQPLPDAYERLILDAIQGDATLFSRSDEIELAWELVDVPLQKEQDPTALQSYAQNSWGPGAANALLESEGRSWMLCCGSEEQGD